MHSKHTLKLTFEIPLLLKKILKILFLGIQTEPQYCTCLQSQVWYARGRPETRRRRRSTGMPLRGCNAPGVSVNTGRSCCILHAAQHLSATRGRHGGTGPCRRSCCCIWCSAARAPRATTTAPGVLPHVRHDRSFCFPSSPTCVFLPFFSDFCPSTASGLILQNAWLVLCYLHQ